MTQSELVLPSHQKWMFAGFNYEHAESYVRLTFSGKTIEIRFRKPAFNVRSPMKVHQSIRAVCFFSGLMVFNGPLNAAPLWKPVPHNDWNASAFVTVNGAKYFAESAEKPYSIQVASNAASDLTRFEVRNGELWSETLGGDDSERAELDGAAGTIYQKGTVVWAAYSFLVEPGAPQISTAGGIPGHPAVWCTLAQFHGNGNARPVPVGLSYRGGKLAIFTQTDTRQINHWTETTPEAPGTKHDVVWNLRVEGLSTDFLNVWLDGVQIVKFTGVIGSVTPDPGLYFKFGIYRGWQFEGYPPLAVQYANVVQGTESLKDRVAAPPAWPLAAAY